MNLKEYLARLLEREGKKVQVNRAQMQEVISHQSKLVAETTEVFRFGGRTYYSGELIEALYKNGKRLKKKAAKGKK